MRSPSIRGRSLPRRLGARPISPRLAVLTDHSAVAVSADTATPAEDDADHSAKAVEAEAMVTESDGATTSHTAVATGASTVSVSSGAGVTPRAGTMTGRGYPRRSVSAPPRPAAPLRPGAPSPVRFTGTRRPPLSISPRIGLGGSGPSGARGAIALSRDRRMTNDPSPPAMAVTRGPRRIHATRSQASRAELCRWAKSRRARARIRAG